MMLFRSLRIDVLKAKNLNVFITTSSEKSCTNFGVDKSARDADGKKFSPEFHTNLKIWTT